MISPETWRRFIRPRIRHIFERIRQGGKHVYLHSCGHITEIIPDLVELGVDMLQPIQPEAMDIFEVKKEFGKDLCLVGGISTQKTLPFGTPQQVRDEVKRYLDVMADGGGYIMAPAKSIMPGVPVEKSKAPLNSPSLRFSPKPRRIMRWLFSLTVVQANSPVKEFFPTRLQSSAERPG